MTWHAIDAFRPSYHATRELLLPFSLTRWLVLAVVVFFVGWSGGFFGTGNVPSGSFIEVPGIIPTFGFDSGVDLNVNFPAVFTSIVILFVALLAILLGILVAVISSIMQFVFVRQLITREIRIRGFFGESLWQGIHLLLFWVGIGLLLVGLMIVALILTIVTFGLFLLVLILLIPLFLVAGIASWLFVRFTFDFVVPIMVAEESGVIEGWRRLWTEIRTDWTQYGVYAVIRFLLDIGAAFAVGLVGVFFLLLLGIPAFIVGFAVYALVSAASPTLAVAIVVGLVSLTLLLVGALTTIIAGVPIQTFLRYYTLFVLARISPQYDLLDEVDTAIDTG